MPPRLGHLLSLLTIVVVVLASAPLWPHGGGLDSYGYHHNRVHGGYHCHRGTFRGAMFDSKAEMLQGLEGLSQSPAKRRGSASTVVQEFSGKVVGVADGDTITVLHGGVGEKIRLHGIDSPDLLWRNFRRLLFK